MTERTQGRLIAGVWVLIGVLTIVNVVLMIVAWRPLASTGDVVFDVIGSLAALAFTSTGLLVAGRARSPVGWVLVVAGISLALDISSSTYPAVGILAHPGSLPAPKIVSTLLQFTIFPGLMSLALVLLLFPDGRPPSPRWRPAVAVAIVGTAVGYVLLVVNPVTINPATDLRFPNPLGLERFGGAISAVLVGLAWIEVLTAIACAAGLVVRYRRGGRELRQQIRWLGLTAVAAGVFLLVALGALVACGCDESPVATVSFVALFLTLTVGIPGALAIAIFRYRLYDLDLFVSKAVLYAMLAAVFTLLYLAIVIGAGALLGDRGNGTLTIVAAVAIALAFNPIRERLRRAANRIVYGERATPFEVLSEFSSRVAGTYAAEDVLPRMAEILARGTGASEARIWLHLGDELRPAAAWPADATAAAPIPANGAAPAFPPGHHGEEVRHQGELLGALTVVMPPSEPMDPSKASLVATLASQAGLVLRNVRLVEDLRASRRRIVSAQDARAKALERNIHDGAQQQLVALTVKQRLAQTLIDRDPAKAKEMLEQLQAETTDALETLRDLARGIYPPLLADRGLVAALEAQARKSAVPVVVEAEGVERYPPEVEAAVYFCCLEALQNVAKYARASGATVRITGDASELRFAVVDDGEGFDPVATRRGTGLVGMADRLEAVGGRLEVDAAPGSGARVGGAVPVAGPMPAAPAGGDAR